jgi:hypothetical protein
MRLPNAAASYSTAAAQRSVENISAPSFCTSALLRLNARHLVPEKMAARLAHPLVIERVILAA